MFCAVLLEGTTRTSSVTPPSTSAAATRIRVPATLRAILETDSDPPSESPQHRKADVADFVEVNSQRDAAKHLLRARYEFLTFCAERENTQAPSADVETKFEEVRYCVALEAMSMIRERLNIFNFAVLQTATRAIPSDLDDAFEKQAAICGHQVAGFLDLLRSVNLCARSVQLYGNTSSGQPISHISCEVLLGGKFRLFDVTSAAVFVDAKNAGRTPTYRDLLSFDELMAMPSGKFHCVANPLDGWRSRFPANTEFHDMAYFAARKPSAISWSIGMSGAIRPLLIDNQSYGRRITTVGIPNFLGRADDHGVPVTRGRGIELIVEDPLTPGELYVELTAVQKPTTTTASLQLRDTAADAILAECRADVGNVVLQIPAATGRVPRELRLTLVADDSEATCYAVWRQAELRNSSPNKPRSVIYETRETGSTSDSALRR